MRSNNKPTVTARRDWLKLATSSLVITGGLLGLGGLLRFLSYEPEQESKTEYDLGSASKYSIGSRTTLQDVPALLIHSQNGYEALSLVCTHLGCTVEDTGQSFICPCHGSRYDPEGVMLRGPAVNPLPHLRLETTADGQLILHTD